MRFVCDCIRLFPYSQRLTSHVPHLVILNGGAQAVLYGEDGRTEYSRRRGRRAAASRFQRGMEDSFSFVECQCYHGGTKLAGSGVIGAQPFRVSISANAAAVRPWKTSLATFIVETSKMFLILNA